MKPKFKTTQDGLVIIDPIERQRFQIQTQTPVTPTPTTTDHLPYPMDTAVEITSGGFTLPIGNVVYVRTPDGSLITEVCQNREMVLERAEYILDISGALKVYISVKSSVHIHTGFDKTDIDFGDPKSIVVSTRSHHTRPAATITATTDPTDMMQAISMFGSAMKTITTERSYPTLRGHPPTIKLGDELDIPDKLVRPNSGVRIKIPPTYRHVFAVAPLAYYLAAEIVPGSTPQLVTDTGYAYKFEGEQGFETTVERILKQVFLLDCIVQTEGETPDDLYERQAIESDLKFDIENMHKRTIAEQLEGYLEVPFATVEPQLPEWWLETQLKPTAEHIEFLPFAANDLSVITVGKENSCSVAATRRQIQTSKERTQTNVTISPDQAWNLLTEPEKTTRKSVSVIQQFWKNKDGTIIPSTKPLSAFQHSIDQSPRDGSLEIEIVCNDPAMSEEVVKVHGTYGKRDDLPFDVTIHHDLSTSGLEEVFTRESDFVHYIGHIDSNGFRCSDGVLDAATVKTVGTKAFFLNACQSYEQGLSLIEAGAIGGIVTLTEVQNSDAVDAGESVARLLNNGFPLYAILDILQKKRNSCQQYHILGDELLTVVQTEQGSPTASTIIRGIDGNEIEIHSYISSEHTQGSVFNPYIAPVDSYHIVSGNIYSSSITNSGIIEFLNIVEFPVLLDGELRWSNEIKTYEL